MGADDRLKRRAYSPKEVAEVLGLSEWTVRNLINKGEIPAIKFGRNWRVPINALDELLGAENRDD